MPLTANSYGKGRVRVARVFRRGDYNEMRDLSVHVMLHGDFGAAYTAGDNMQVIATDTIKNICYIVARQHMQACAEDYAQAVARCFLDRYKQVGHAVVTTTETRWTRATFDGAPHAHSFTLDGNGKSTVTFDSRHGVKSGVAGYTFMKTTASGWVDYVMDEYTTLAPTTDRIAATAMDATWDWSAAPADYEAANNTILQTMLKVFATTYSKGVQDSLYRMGEAALAAVPEIKEIRMACPNKHYIPINLDKFGLHADNMIFVATDEPHGQIECQITRG